MATAPHSVSALALRGLYWPAMACILLLPLTPLAPPHPGLQAAAVCLSTLIVLLRQHPGLGKGALQQPIARLGDGSYALYLAHWPLVAFAHNSWVGVPGEWSIGLRVALLALSLLAAALLYWVVERPFRVSPLLLGRRGAIAAVLVCVPMIAIVPLALHMTAHNDRWSALRLPNFGLDPRCDSGEPFADKRMPEILKYAKECGLKTMINTNGSDPHGIYKDCLPFIDWISFSIDEQHNNINHETFKNVMQAKIAQVKNIEIQASG
jgi:peptidoglycan/LPS O-acetylase OafA/YrhL